MTRLDDTDWAIIEALQANGRATYQDIAEKVDLSGPAVSQRVDQLKDAGVIRGFSIDLDRRRLVDGDLNHVVLRLPAANRDTVLDSLNATEAIEAVYPLADGRIALLLWAPAGQLFETITELIDTDDIQIESAQTVSDPNR